MRGVLFANIDIIFEHRINKQKKFEIQSIREEEVNLTVRKWEEKWHKSYTTNRGINWVIITVLTFSADVFLATISFINHFRGTHWMNKNIIWEQNTVLCALYLVLT